jgi:hypothetical protein
LHHGNFVFCLPVLFEVQILATVSAPGSCRVPGAVYCCGYPLGGPSEDVIGPGLSQPGFLAPEVSLDRIGRVIRFCLAAVAAGLLSLLPERRLVRLIAMRRVAARGTRVAWREAFQALAQVISRPAGLLIASR